MPSTARAGRSDTQRAEHHLVVGIDGLFVERDAHGDRECAGSGALQGSNVAREAGRTALFARRCRAYLQIVPPSTLASVADAPTHAVLSPAYRLIFRLEIANKPGMFAQEIGRAH